MMILIDDHNWELGNFLTPDWLMMIMIYDSVTQYSVTINTSKFNLTTFMSNFFCQTHICQMGEIYRFVLIFQTFFSDSVIVTSHIGEKSTEFS